MDLKSGMQWWSALVIGVAVLFVGVSTAGAQQASPATIDFPSILRELDIVGATVKSEKLSQTKKVKWAHDVGGVSILWVPSMGPEGQATRQIQFSAPYATESFKEILSAQLWSDNTIVGGARHEFMIQPFYFTAPVPPGWTRTGTPKNFIMARKQVLGKSQGGGIDCSMPLCRCTWWIPVRIAPRFASVWNRDPITDRSRPMRWPSCSANWALKGLKCEARTPSTTTVVSLERQTIRTWFARRGGGAMR